MTYRCYFQEHSDLMLHGHKELHLIRQHISIHLPTRTCARVQNNTGRTAIQNRPHAYHYDPWHEPGQVRRNAQTQLQGYWLAQVLEELARKLNSFWCARRELQWNKFHTRLKALTLAIMDTVKSTIPKCCPSPYAKRWCSKEPWQKCAEVQWLGRKAYTKRGIPEEPVLRPYKSVRNEYGTMIKTVKKVHWDDFLQSSMTRASGLLTDMHQETLLVVVKPGYLH